MKKTIDIKTKATYKHLLLLKEIDTCYLRLQALENEKYDKKYKVQDNDYYFAQVP